MIFEEMKPLIAGVTVQSLQKKEVVLESLWKERRIVLAFLRHFG